MTKEPKIAVFDAALHIAKGLIKEKI